MNPQMALAITAKNQTKPVFNQVVADANQVGAALQSSGTRAAGAMNATAFATGNVAAQLNDIGVMMASGQSPLTLAIQQGTQLNQIFAGMSGAQVLGSLKTAFLSLLNPISLITIGTIAAGAALFQYVTSLNTDGRDSTEVIKEQNDLIRGVADNWGDAVPALRAYVDELDRAADTRDLGEAAQVAAKRAFEDILPVIEEVGLAFDALVQTSGMGANEAEALSNAYYDLIEDMREGSAEAGQLEAFLQMLEASAVGNTGAAAALAEMMREVGAAFNFAAGRAAAYGAEADAALMQGPDISLFTDNKDFVAELERINGLTSEQLTLEREVERVRAEAKRSDVLISDQQALELARQTLAAEERRAELRSGERSGSKAADAVQKERDAVAELIAELEHEQQLIGMSNVEKEIANALRQAGAAATEEERLRIEELIVAIDEQELAQKQLTEGWEDYGKMGKSAVKGVWDALRDGKVEANEVADILDRLGQMAWDLAFKGLGSLFGGNFGGGGFLGGLFGFSEGGGGVVGGAGTYTPGGADDTLFIAKAQKGEPFAFGQAAVDGLVGGAGGQSVLIVRLDEGLIAEVVSRAVGQSVQVTRGMVEPVSRTVSQMAQQQRFG